jgi:hypothetical protein
MILMRSQRHGESRQCHPDDGANYPGFWMTLMRFRSPRQYHPDYDGDDYPGFLGNDTDETPG